MDLDHDLDELPLWMEVRRYPVGPDRTFRGMRCEVPVVEVCQVAADPCPFKPLRLFRWSRRRARP